MATSAEPRQPARGPGRPPKPPENSSSALAQLGGLVRCLRGERELTLMSLGKLTGYSWQHLSAVERGEVVPSEAVVVGCESALAAGGQLAALYPAVVREQASHRHGREAARRGDAVRTDLDVEWARLGAAARQPSATSISLVEELEQITDRQRVLYHELSSAEIVVSVEAHLSLLVSLLRRTQPEPLRHRIASAAVEAAGFAAWLWLDLGDQFKMGALYKMAGDLFTESGNPALAAYITGYRALAAEAWGLGREAVHQAEAARDRAPAGTSQLVRSWLSAVGADALALTGDRCALNLLGEACGHLEAAQGKEEWMYDFDHSALAAYRGQCHLRLGQTREAMGAFEAGLTSLPPSCDRRGAFLAIGLAEACLAERMVDAATHYAQRALTVFAMSGSLAGLRRVQRYRRLLADAGHDREASDLDQQVRAHLAATT